MVEGLLISVGHVALVWLLGRSVSQVGGPRNPPVDGYRQ